MTSIYGDFAMPSVDEDGESLEFSVRMDAKNPGVLEENLLCQNGKMLPAGTHISNWFFDCDEYVIRVKNRVYYSDNKPVLSY